MKKITLFIVLAMIVSQTISAAVITSQEAKDLASAFFSKKGKTIVEVSLTRSYGSQTETEESHPYYIFNSQNDEGFVIISGDDTLPTILGYSDNGFLDEKTLPEWHPLYSLLRHYAHQITNSKKVKAASKTFNKPQEEIAPLLTSKWGQHGQYNLFSPIVDGERCPTGCIATAFAQVMYYHKWPQAATSPIEGYTTYEKRIEMPDLPSIVFEWDKMANDYAESENISEGEAVSRLMLYVGYAVNMSYTSMYSAATIDHARNFVELFGYSCKTKLVRRSNYSPARWMTLLHNELKEGRPIVYSAFSPYDGHGFVLDGYCNDGLFHVSWGWYGACDGYYHIDLLNTYDGEIEGDGFTCEQSAIIGLCPPQPDDVEDPQLDIYPSVTPIEQEEYTRLSANTDFQINLHGCISSYRDEPFDVEAGWGLFQKDELVNILSSEKMSINGDIYWHGYMCDSEVHFGAGLANGQYEIKQIYRYSGHSEYTPCLETNRHYVRAFIDGNTLTLHVSNPKDISVVVDSVEYIGSLKERRAVELAIHLTNTSDVYEVPLYLWKEGELNRLSRVTAYVLPGESCIALMHMVPTENCDLYLTTDQKGENRIWYGHVTLRHDDMTTISSIKQTHNSNYWTDVYDLSGKKVSSKILSRPNIYILNGKKIIMR